MIGIVTLLFHWVALKNQVGEVGKAGSALPETWVSLIVSITITSEESERDTCQCSQQVMDSLTDAFLTPYSQ